MITLALFTPDGNSMEASSMNIPTDSEVQCQKLERVIYLGGYLLWNGELDSEGNITQTDNRGKHNDRDIHLTARCALYRDGRDTSFDDLIEKSNETIRQEQ